MTFHPRTATTPLAAVVLAILVALAPGTAASADDGSVAWSVTPAGADGAADARSRLEFQLDPGGTATDHVLIDNASTTDETFRVYGADAINTSSGGYDLLTADKTSTDAGSWVSIDQPQVTVPALKSAVVAVTVAVPTGATPGDHSAGVVVSRVVPQTTSDGVVMDTRVAVRLSVRVAGELAPALAVSGLKVDYTPSLVPFGPSEADVSYTVRNTGNVTVLGEPRLRVTGPLGITLASAASGTTQEVLPGQSFTVSSTLAGVDAALVDTAVVDVTMVAAPGPDTQIPLVSTTSRATFAAVPWTGILAIVVLGLGVWWFLRQRRLRRVEGESMWAELVEHAKGGDVLVTRPGASDRSEGSASALLLVACLLVGGAVGGAVATSGSMTAQASGALPGGVATARLSVPAAPTATSSASQAATASATPTAATTTTTTTSNGTTTTTTMAGTVRRPASGNASTPGPGAGSSQVLSESGSSSTPTPTPSAAVLPADAIWRSPSGFTPAQWGLVSVSGLVLLGAAGLAVRAFLTARAAQVAG
ncbi:MAG: hypothetical protein KJ792_07750 [Actinobacteria bacterium]|nr:hypothetical protein [Actinomycetota bacterium]MCG2801163.1 hypothetical protein [Cellulomonas sp.]